MAGEAGARSGRESDAVTATPGRRLGRWLGRPARIPGPAWAGYLVAGVALVVVEVALARADGVPVQPFTIYFAVAGVYALAFVDLSRRAAGGAFDRYRPALAARPPKQVAQLRRDLNAVPVRPIVLVVAGFLVIGVTMLPSARPVEPQLRDLGLAGSPVALALQVALFLFNYGATGAAVHRIAHQSRQIARITALGRVDLFHPGPLHALAVLCAASVAGVAIMFYAPVFLVPSLGDPTVWATRIAVGAVLTFLFLWPLWGVHRVLAAERGALLDRNVEGARRFNDRLHAALADGATTLPDQERNVIDALEREAKALRSLSTWPWPAEVIPTVLGAIVLPLVASVLLALAQQLVAG